MSLDVWIVLFRRVWEWVWRGGWEVFFSLTGLFFISIYCLLIQLNNHFLNIVYLIQADRILVVLYSLLNFKTCLIVPLIVPSQGAGSDGVPLVGNFLPTRKLNINIVLVHFIPLQTICPPPSLMLFSPSSTFFGYGPVNKCNVIL